MDLGYYLVLTILIVAGTFFSLALYHRASPSVLKFTAYGFATLAVLGFILVQFAGSRDLKIAMFIFIGLSAFYYWFYGGTLKDNDGN
ncbi:MAG: hypothetical protein A2817_01490 [Candidatus Yanofskybacteria bacterium RIFCSPHIGHO2_01_FULL_39_8b]|uniref:Uncharacterized protein n=1 Tax=Candidatus Yanofskybacteria bacterium RIFCSPHIGHO2_01_FULL_39_8b TaxID=1802659 RepID=A0A1F8E8H7_9BACT|nr:MAG: hypothetical protein A2817_01490 [Candidatus Yanofskybacteria bacterium RIFCSPHIGHO2_01_FULL_39_8b]